MKNKKIFIILPHLGGGGAEKSTLYLVNDWGNLDRSTDWCTHTKNNFTIVQEWESNFANVYKPNGPNGFSI